MIILNRSMSWVVALCRISSSVVGLISGVPTSAAPRLVLQISDLHLRRYPIRNGERLKPELSQTTHNAPLAMHYLADIRPEPARGLISFWYQTWGLISFWYQTWGLISFWYQTWGLISFWYQTCDGSGFEFVYAYVQTMYNIKQRYNCSVQWMKLHVCADSHWLLVDLTK